MTINEQKFIEEFDKLCEKYNCRIICVYPDTYVVCEDEEDSIFELQPYEEWLEKQNKIQETTEKRKKEKIGVMLKIIKTSKFNKQDKNWFDFIIDKTKTTLFTGEDRYALHDFIRLSTEEKKSVIREALSDEMIKYRVCKQCGSHPKNHKVVDYDSVWRDGNVTCTICDAFVRSFDAG